MGDPEGGGKSYHDLDPRFFDDFCQIHDHLPKPSLVEETRILHVFTIFCEFYQIALLGVGFKKCSHVLGPFFSFENSIDTQTKNVKKA